MARRVYDRALEDEFKRDASSDDDEYAEETKEEHKFMLSVASLPQRGQAGSYQPASVVVTTPTPGAVYNTTPGTVSNASGIASPSQPNFSVSPPAPSTTSRTAAPLPVATAIEVKQIPAEKEKDKPQLKAKSSFLSFFSRGKKKDDASAPLTAADRSSSDSTIKPTHSSPTPSSSDSVLPLRPNMPASSSSPQPAQAAATKSPSQFAFLGNLRPRLSPIPPAAAAGAASSSLTEEKKSQQPSQQQSSAPPNPLIRPGTLDTTLTGGNLSARSGVSVDDEEEEDLGEMGDYENPAGADVNYDNDQQQQESTSLTTLRAQISTQITCMSLHPTEPLLAIGLSPNTIKIWNIRENKYVIGKDVLDPATGVMRNTGDAQHLGRITALAWRNDGRRLLSASSYTSPELGSTHSIKLWKLDRVTHILQPPPNIIGQDDIDASLPRLSGNGIIRALRKTKEEADGGINSGLSGGENTGSSEHVTLNCAVALGFIAQGWTNEENGKHYSTEDLLSSTGSPPLQILHQDPITSLAFMPLSSHPCIKLLSDHGIRGINIYASGSYDKTIKVWCYDSNMDCTVHVLRQHTSAVTCCSFSPDGFMLITGSEDASVIVWRISLEPVYDMPRAQGQTGLNSSTLGPNGKPVEPASSSSGRMVSCVPIIVQNLRFDCYSGSPHQPDLEPVYCLSFFPAVHHFGRYPEYTIVVGTSASLIILRAHAMRIHESPLTSMPQFLRVCRKLHKHSRLLKGKHHADGTAGDGDDPDKQAAEDEDDVTSRRKIDPKNKSTGTTKLQLRPNFLQISEIYRQKIDARYGSIRSMSCDMYELERHMLYDLEDAMDAAHVGGEGGEANKLPILREKQCKLLLTNHENEGHTLVWILNEDINQRTRLPVIRPAWCVLGKQNSMRSDILLQALTKTTSLIGRHTGSANFLGNYCESVFLPSAVLRKKLVKAQIQRGDIQQIVCFTLNCTKSVGDNSATGPSSSSSSSATSSGPLGNGIWSLKFAIEASVDLPGDLEPTISSKIAYEALRGEAEERRKWREKQEALNGNGNGGSAMTSLLFSGTPLLGNANPDFIGHLSSSYEIEYSLPAFQSILHPMGQTMNEAMRLKQHQRMMNLQPLKLERKKIVFEEAAPDPVNGVGGGNTKKKSSSKKTSALASYDTSGFATNDSSATAGASSGGASLLLSDDNNDLAPSSSRRSRNGDDGFMSTRDPGLASSKHLFLGQRDELGSAAQVSSAGSRRQAGIGGLVRYAETTEQDARASNATTLELAASERAAVVANGGIGGRTVRRAGGKKSVSYADSSRPGGSSPSGSDASGSDGDDDESSGDDDSSDGGGSDTSRSEGASRNSRNKRPIVSWQATSSTRTSAASSAGHQQRAPSRLAQLSQQAQSASVQNSGLAGKAQKVVKEVAKQVEKDLATATGKNSPNTTQRGDTNEPGSNARQCTNSNDCTIQ